MDQDLETMRREKASWEQECLNLRAEYSSLSDELEETKNSLRLTLTDKATSEAFDAAAALMKKQLYELQDRLDSIQALLARERSAKEAATTEATRLRSNIAALLGMEDNDENRTAMEQRLMDATDSCQRLERTEISALKDSLSRTMKELAEARSSEKKMEEKAASASHRASLYEAEVVNTKNDFGFLSRTLDDIRDSEASKIASLEFHMSSIKNEHSVQTKIYAAELENLRNELSQTNLERDRLLHALNESESNRESIAQTSSRDFALGDDTSSELARLRIERAQLLSAAAAEASRVERRLRENRARVKAAAEAEVIMERELRLAAERSLESTKAELDSIRLSTNGGQEGTSDTTNKVKDHLAMLQCQLNDAKASRETLETEIGLLQSQLVETRRERDIDVARMSDECQKLRVRINHVEREGRFEAQVIAEAARLKASESISVVAPETKEEKSVEVIALWDHIKKLQGGIKKERTMYYEKKSEHDDLLAMLARQDLMKDSLSQALASLAGQEAVDDALRQANHLAAGNPVSLYDI
jgi:chromosome segregation ATPase